MEQEKGRKTVNPRKGTKTSICVGSVGSRFPSCRKTVNPRKGTKTLKEMSIELLRMMLASEDSESSEGD